MSLKENVLLKLWDLTGMFWHFGPCRTQCPDTQYWAHSIHRHTNHHKQNGGDYKTWLHVFADRFISTTELSGTQKILNTRPLSKCVLKVTSIKSDASKKRSYKSYFLSYFLFHTIFLSCCPVGNCVSFNNTHSSACLSAKVLCSNSQDWSPLQAITFQVFFVSTFCTEIAVRPHCRLLGLVVDFYPPVALQIHTKQTYPYHLTVFIYNAVCFGKITAKSCQM